MPFCKKCCEFVAGSKFCEKCGALFDRRYCTIEIPDGLMDVVVKECSRLGLSEPFVLSSILDDTRTFELCNKIIELNPTYAEAWAERGHCLSELERYEEAVAQFDRAIQLQPNKAFPLIMKAETLELMEKWEEVLAAYERAAQIEPNCGEIWIEKGKALLSLERVDEALLAFDKATQVEPDLGSNWMEKGHWMMMINRRVEALAAYEHAVQLEIERLERARALDAKAWALWELGRHEEALAENKGALLLDPRYDGGWDPTDYDSGWNTRGIWLFFMRRYDEALAAFDHAIESEYETTPEGIRQLPPHWVHYRAEAMVMKGFVLRALGRHEEAATLFDELSKLEPLIESVHFSVADKILQTWGRYEEAAIASQRAKLASKRLRQAQG